MMTFRWSWIFTVLTLLVQLGNANFPTNDDPFVNKLHRREELFDTHSYVVSATPMSTKNIGIIVACVVAGVAISCAGLGYAYLSRSRRLRVPHVEEGMESPSSTDSTWKPKSNNLRSQFSPDESSGFDRIRAAFGRRKKHEAILPVYNVPLPPGSVESIERPQPAAQGHVPRYPSILERGNSQRSFDSDTPPPKKSPPSKRASPPPPLKGLPELARTPSSSSTSSRLSGPRAQSKVSKRPQVPPKAVLVPPPGRPLPGLSGSKTAHTPKSPSKRRSWLSKHTFKHPFIPFRSPDISLKFPPGSPLGGYHPSRQHLEARFDMVTPRVSSPLAESPRRIPPASAKEVQRREHVIKRQPVPLVSPGPSSARQAKIVEALHSAEIEGQRTPTGYRTAIPPTITIKPLKTPKTPKTVRIAASPMRADSPVMPTTAYI
jgi:hypothetical protein